MKTSKTNRPATSETVVTRYAYKLFLAGLVLTIALMPLDRFKNLATKPPYLSVISLLLLAQYLAVLTWQRYQAGGFRAIPKRLAMAFVLPVVAAAIATLFAFNPAIAASWTILFLFAVGRGWLFGELVTERELKLVETTILIVAAVVVAIGYFQYLGDIFGLSNAITHLQAGYSSNGTFAFPRVHSTAQEPLYLGHYLLLPIGILLVRLRQSRLRKLGYAQLILTLGLLFTGTARSTILGLLIAIILLVVLSEQRRWVWRMLGVLVAGAVIAYGLLYLAGYLKKHDTVKTYGGHTIDLQDESARTRYDLWPTGGKLFLQHPIVGVGPNNSRVLIHSPAERMGNDPKKLQPLNNDYISYVAETGLIGIMAVIPLIMLLFESVRTVFRSRFRSPAAPYVFALIGMAVQANAFQSLLLLRTWIVIGLAIAATQITPKQHVKARR